MMGRLIRAAVIALGLAALAGLAMLEAGRCDPDLGITRGCGQ